MRKKAAILLALVMSAALAACGGAAEQETPEEGDVTQATEEEQEPVFAASDYVDPAPYDTIEIETAPVKQVDKADIQTEIDRFLADNEQLVEIKDRTEVETGDTVRVSYVLKADGEEVEDAAMEDLNVEVGQGTMPEGFEEGLVGAQVGSSKEITLTLPEDYQDSDLAGKEVVYEVEIQGIYAYQIPELNDEFLASIGKVDNNNEPIDTVDKLYAYFKDQLQAQADSEHEEAVNTAILSYLMDNSTFKQDIPADYVSRIETAYTKMYQEYAKLYGEDLSAFMTRIGSTEESYQDDIHKIAEQYSRQVMILRAIGEKENLLPTDAEMEDYAAQKAASFGYASVEAYEKDFDIELVYDNLICDRVLAYLKGHVKAKETAEAAKKTDPADLVGKKCRIKIKHDELIIRTGPGKDYSELTRVPKGKVVTVLEIDESGKWARISFDEMEGYCAVKYLKLKKKQ